jgi:hypothetical protein
LKHFKKLQGNLEFHQNKTHPGGVPDMRRQCEKAADQWWLYGDTLQEAIEENPILKVNGGQSLWSTGHMIGRSAATWHVRL